MKTKALALAIAVVGTAWAGTALADCQSYISDFRNTVDSDFKSGKMDKKRHDQITTEVDRIDKLCRDDQAGALRVLITTQERYGYRGPRS